MDTSEVPGAMVPENRISCDTRSRLEKGTYTEWQLFFLLRLEALLRLEEEYVKLGGAASEEGQLNVKMLHKAIYSTYADCIDLGVGDAARRMFKELTTRA